MALQLPTIPLNQLNQRPLSLAELIQPQLANLQTSAQLGLAPLQQQLKQADVQNIPLNRQILQAQAQYAAPEAAAKLKEMLAHAGYLGAEASAIPQRLGIEQSGLDLRKQELQNLIRMHPDALINADVQKAISQAQLYSSKADKNEEIIGYDQNGLPITKRLDTPASAQDNAFYASGFGKSSRGKANTFYNPITKEAISALTPARLTQLQQQNYAIKAAIPLLQDLKEAGAKGYLGEPTISGNEYSDYKGKLSSLVEHLQKAQLMGQSVGAMKKIEDQFRRYSRETESHYRNRIDSEISRFQKAGVDNEKTLSLGGIALGGQSSAIGNIPTKEQALAALKSRGAL